METLAALLGLDSALVKSMLTERVVKTRTETFTIKLKVEEASLTRDAIVKSLYEVGPRLGAIDSSEGGAGRGQGTRVAASQVLVVWLWILRVSRHARTRHIHEVHTGSCTKSKQDRVSCGTNSLNDDRSRLVAPLSPKPDGISSCERASDYLTNSFFWGHL